MYSFLHPYRRTTSIYRWRIGLPSVPTVPMDKVFWGLPYALAIMLTTSFTKGFCTFTDRVFISPSVPTDNFDLPMENWFTIGTDRTDGQGFWGLPYCNVAKYLIHERILHIYRSCIHFFIRTDGQLRFTDGELVYHRYRPYRWTRFLGATLCPCNNANYLIHERILHIYRSRIHFSIRTDGQLRFTDGELVYHRYRPYRWTRFLGATYALAIMLTTSFTKGFCTFTDRVFISPSVPTDNFDLPMENWFTIGTDRTDGQGFWGLPYALAIMLTTSFTKGFCTFTDRVFISPSVPTDNFDLPMENWFTIGTDRTDGQGFWGATLCPCNNANYLIHERILHIYRSCIHFSIRTDGQLRFTDGELVYHRYRPYRWTRFFGGYLMPLQ